MYSFTLGLFIIFGVSVSSGADSSLPDARIRKARISNGEITSIDKFPFIVFIKANLNDTVGQCGGSILSSTVIITAAHCLNKTLSPSIYRVRAGSSFSNREGSIHWVRNYTIHPNFNDSMHDDVALLVLENPIKLNNETTRSIDLFEPGRKIPDFTSASTAGWGDLDSYGSEPDILQSLNYLILGHGDCSQIYQVFFVDSYNKSYTLSQGTICGVSYEDNYESTCHGDSGGPLVVDNKLAGIVSFGSMCSSLPLPNAFTEVAYYREWIDVGLGEYRKIKVQSTIYNDLITKVDDLKTNVTEHLTLVHLTLFGDPDIEEMGHYLFNGMIEYRVDEMKEALAEIFGDGLESKCDEILEANATVLTDELYSCVNQEAKKLLKSNNDTLDSKKKEIEILERTILQCLRNNQTSGHDLCEKNKIEAEVNKIYDFNFKYLSNTITRTKNLIIAKNETYVSSLFHEYIFKSAVRCMESL